MQKKCKTCMCQVYCEKIMELTKNLKDVEFQCPVKVA